MSEPIGRSGTSQSETALGIIRDRILDLTLAPGSHIDERALMTRYGLGRTPTREALNRLASEGLVHLRANRGAFVRPLDLTETAHFFDAYFAAERLIGYFCRFDHHALVKDIMAIQDHHGAAIARNDLLDITRHNADFHLRIAEATDNSYVYDFSARVHAAARRMLFFVYRSEKELTVRRVFAREQQGIVGDHAEIIDCLRRTDRTALIDALTRHGQRFQGRLMTLIGHSDGATFQPW
ncbi:GntR family transcriptional regulator [Roseospira visakhapatnamensis]|uniref:DNA-binding GntR family transcriptional regulator n=1 Tax=Roseospira visakhapatnamensis TaxID=390880 RepID=A0A7W6R9M1_9PROT|nr:GntR family transcriptional regulator [Roseospira visakhapatnamensis]MBB4264459.1 DNA-binding GntR family transcriptional regulator [Roseospira visakhapatnamensis]